MAAECIVGPIIVYANKFTRRSESVEEHPFGPGFRMLHVLVGPVVRGPFLCTLLDDVFSSSHKANILALFLGCRRFWPGTGQ